jgi:predicted deacylase
MTAPLREDFTIPYHDFGPAGAPPRVALVAGLHGDEANGIFVLGRLASFLRRLEADEQSGRGLRERVLILPAVNLLGLNTRSRVWPFDGTDLNRMFPGYAVGETTQRVAHAVLELTRAAHYRVDIHSSNLAFEEVPQVRLYQPTSDERASALLFGFPAILERAPNPVFSTTIGCAWRAYGGENFVIQVGQAGSIQAQHCDRLFRALMRFLVATETLVGIDLAAEEEDIHCFGVKQTFPVISRHAGVFVSPLEVGHWLQAGDVIGQVYDGFDGEQIAEIRTPVAGMLSGVRREPWLFEGDLVARMQTRHQLSEGLDIGLLGHAQ